MRRLWIGLAVVLALLVVGGAYAYRTWDYVRHDDGFCVSCHPGGGTFERFSRSGHADLNCRDCHEQSLSASLREVAWEVKRPEKVGPHAAVREGVCADCHNAEQPDSTWPRIAATAGHSVHLEADTSALKGVVCLTCHGKQIHRFVPAEQTCGQSGCHDRTKTDLVLGNMAGQTSFHCVTCHQFTTPLSGKAPSDTVGLALVSGLETCAACHERENLLGGIDPKKDPHNGVCGTCHTPHSEEPPAKAATRCAECHAPVQGLTPFHRGLPDDVLANCTRCHSPHTFRVDGSDCMSCHVNRYVTPPERPGGFDHRNHAGIDCTTCHSTQGSHGRVALQMKTGCMECHHGKVSPERGCATCHGENGPAGVERVSVAMDLKVWRAPRTRQLPFPHAKHAPLGCETCHTGGVRLAPQRTCASCHDRHHTATADCTRCHFPSPLAKHTGTVHTTGCAGSGCHEQRAYGSMAAGRNTCLVCHQDRADHMPGQACARCHRVTFGSGAQGGDR